MSNENTNLNKWDLPEGFTVMMAMMDGLPVLFFSVMVGVLSMRFNSLLFFIGAFLVIMAGTLKCLWKFMIALFEKNIPFLFYQMRVLMPIGFLVIVLSLMIDRNQLSMEAILGQIISMPAIFCYIIGVVGMICMSVFARKLDKNNAKHNWIEQGTNAVTQFFFMLGVML